MTVEGQKVWYCLILDVKSTLLPIILSQTHLRNITDVWPQQQERPIHPQYWRVHCVTLGLCYHQHSYGHYQNYDKDSIALLIPSLSLFAVKVPLILGTAMLEWDIEAMKKSKWKTRPLSGFAVHWSQAVGACRISFKGWNHQRHWWMPLNSAWHHHSSIHHRHHKSKEDLSSCCWPTSSNIFPARRRINAAARS